MKFSKSSIEIEIVLDSPPLSPVSFVTNAQDLIMLLEDIYYLSGKDDLGNLLNSIRSALNECGNRPLAYDRKGITSRILINRFEQGEASILYRGRRLSFGRDVTKEYWHEGSGLASSGGYSYLTTDGALIYETLEWIS